MSKLGLLAMAAQLAPRFIKLRRGTWIAIGVGLLLLFGLLIWAAVAVLGWLFGQAQGLAGMAREAAVGPAQAVLDQVEQVVPGAREQLDARLGTYLPGQMSETQAVRDVSGEDLGPVPRYPGLARLAWQRHEAGASVEYTGRADFDAVLRHYAEGFAGLGYLQTVQSANREAETHVYTKGSERYSLILRRQGQADVSVRIESAQS